MALNKNICFAHYKQIFLSRYHLATSILLYDISLCLLGIDANLNFEINMPIKSVKRRKKEKAIRKLYMYQINKLIKKGA